jgi:hypothetical protein
MSGSVFLTGLVFVVLLVAAIFMTPWALIPAVLLVGVFLLAGSLAGAARGTGGDREGRGTPSTADASYDPVTQPGQRTA